MEFLDKIDQLSLKNALYYESRNCSQDLYFVFFHQLFDALGEHKDNNLQIIFHQKLSNVLIKKQKLVEMIESKKKR